MFFVFDNLWLDGFLPSGCQARQKLNLADLENKYNAVIGVYAVDMENGKKICYKPDTRFSYCSTHKVFTAAELLRQKNTSDLNEIRKFSAEDICPTRQSPKTMLLMA